MFRVFTGKNQYIGRPIDDAISGVVGTVWKKCELEFV
jgi:hypothetical protein